ncbi:MAG: tungsten formylmethanofuran dehydrogenase [Bacteroidetes bacterium]|nr:tungsten formylmethanofuran dehydrogenase [Bacteroidota bacterium]
MESKSVYSSLVTSHVNYSQVWELMCRAKAMTDLYENQQSITAKYVHATSRGHEAIQIALGSQLKPQDFVFPYYRDDSMLLAMGMRPYELMLQLLAKQADPFSGGRTYYSHPSLNDPTKPKIPHQSSATGMQAIPATGVALGFWYREQMKLESWAEGQAPVAVCSLGDASITEGEVAEAFQMAVLKSLPILYLVQDNEWDISAHASEFRAMDASNYAKGFNGLEVRAIDGTDFVLCYQTLQEVLELIRKERRPFLIHAKVPLLNHHTSGVRKEWYRDDLEVAARRDPIVKFRQFLSSNGYTDLELNRISELAVQLVQSDFEEALAMPDPNPEELEQHIFAETPVIEERGERHPKGKLPTVMVDCALFAVRELMEKHPECLLYGQDVGARLGGVFREAATLAKSFGSHRVFNTPIQEAFIVGSTVGMSAVGLKPIVEVQFADYIWPGLNQLFTEVSRSNYLSNGKWPVSCVLRVPIGAYGSGGPYHSSSVESVVLQIRGVKVAYPSTGADLKGLLKAAYYDPNPVVMLEHKGLYWSKIKGTEGAKTVEPDSDYILPFGKARLVLASEVRNEPTAVVVTYGRGVFWALEAAQDFPGKIEILDLRTLNPWDKETVVESVKKHGRALVLTEEPLPHSFAMALVGEIQMQCFSYLDAPIAAVGSANTPAIPLNSTLEQAAIPNAEKVGRALQNLLAF